MRAGLATLLFSVLILAAAPNSGQHGEARLVGRTTAGERVVVDEAWREAAGRLRLVRRTSSGALQECLEVEADLADADDVRVVYRRDDDATKVAVDVEGGSLRVQVGPIVETHSLPGRPIPTALLRLLPPGVTAGRRLLLEPFAAVHRGHVSRHQDPASGAQVLAWGAAGVSERVRMRQDGALLDAEAPELGLRLVRRGEPDVDDPLRPCGPPPMAIPGRFDDLGEIDLSTVETPRDLEDWVADVVEYSVDDATPTASEVLRRGHGDCVGMAFLAGAAARALHWRARQVVGTIDGPSGPGWHQWLEVRRGGRWVSVDPAAPYAQRRPVRRFAARPRSLLSNELMLLTTPL